MQKYFTYDSKDRTEIIREEDHFNLALSASRSNHPDSKTPVYWAIIGRPHETDPWISLFEGTIEECIGRGNELIRMYDYSAITEFAKELRKKHKAIRRYDGHRLAFYEAQDEKTSEYLDEFAIVLDKDDARLVPGITGIVAAIGLEILIGKPIPKGPTVV